MLGRCGDRRAWRSSPSAGAPGTARRCRARRRRYRCRPRAARAAVSTGVPSANRPRLPEGVKTTSGSVMVCPPLAASLLASSLAHLELHGSPNAGLRPGCARRKSRFGRGAAAIAQKADRARGIAEADALPVRRRSEAGSSISNAPSSMVSSADRGRTKGNESPGAGRPRPRRHSRTRPPPRPVLGRTQHCAGRDHHGLRTRSLGTVSSC